MLSTAELRDYWARFDADLLAREAEVIARREARKASPAVSGFSPRACERCSSSFQPTGPRSRYCAECR